MCVRLTLLIGKRNCSVMMETNLPPSRGASYDSMTKVNKRFVGLAYQSKDIIVPLSFRQQTIE
jgi:hypothetical protein